MAFDREAAKKAGYTDQEIDQFLAHQSQAPGANEPPPPSTQVPEIDQTNSMMASGAGAAVAAAPYAAGAYGAAKLGGMIPGAVNAVKGMMGGAPVAPAANATAKAVAPKVAEKAAEMASRNAIKEFAIQGLKGGAQAVRAMASGPVAPFAAVAAVPGAMMAHDAANFSQQTPDQQQESAQSALAGQSPGQAYY